MRLLIQKDIECFPDVSDVRLTNRDELVIRFCKRNKKAGLDTLSDIVIEYSACQDFSAHENDWPQPLHRQLAHINPDVLSIVPKHGDEVAKLMGMEKVFRPCGLVFLGTRARSTAVANDVYLGRCCYHFQTIFSVHWAISMITLCAHWSTSW